MSKLPSRLRRLDAALADLPGEEEPLLLTELDGYLAGIVVSPEPIPSPEWLPLIWEGEAAPFEDPVDVEQFVRMLVAHETEIRRGLAHGRYRPIFDIDDRHGEIMWELWIEGLALAMSLRPEAWKALAQSRDEDVAAACSGLLMLIEIARDESDMARELIDKVTDQAPDLIPTWLDVLYSRRAAAIGLDAGSAPATKVGRNDPCPCGSGKKHKRCCGLS